MQLFLNLPTVSLYIILSCTFIICHPNYRGINLMESQRRAIKSRLCLTEKAASRELLCSTLQCLPELSSRLSPSNESLFILLGIQNNELWQNNVTAQFYRPCQLASSLDLGHVHTYIRFPSVFILFSVLKGVENKWKCYENDTVCT